jgi:hydrogenase expression/formation protein HypE
VSGPVGDHGAVIAATRSGLDPAGDPDGGVRSDCAPVHHLVDALYAAGVRPVFMRDPTRGGLATVLAESARAAGVTIEVREDDLPIRDGVRGVCDVLGLDPLYLACEGRFVAVVEAGDAARSVDALRAAPGGSLAAAIGSVIPMGPGPVLLRTGFGGRRVYDTLASDPLPRIC